MVKLPSGKENKYVLLIRRKYCSGEQKYGTRGSTMTLVQTALENRGTSWFCPIHYILVTELMQLYALTLSAVKDSLLTSHTGNKPFVNKQNCIKL